MTPEDFFIQLVNSLPFPYNLLAIFIIIIYIFLAKLYYTRNKNKVNEFLDFHIKHITVGLILIIISTAFLSAIYFVHESFFFPEPPEDRFIVAISPFYAVSPQGYSVDMYTPGKIKEEIEKVEGNTINAIILDSPPITDDKDAVQKGKKTGAHLVIYGVDHRVVTGETITEFYIISTNTSSTTPLFLDVNSSKKAIPILYSDKSIRFESVKQNVSSAVYTALAFEYYRKYQYVSAVSMFKYVKDYEKEGTILFYIGNCYSEISEFNQSRSNKRLINKNLVNESLLYYNKAIQLDPNNSLAWNNKGYSLDTLGRYEEAINAFDKAIQLDPNNSLAWNNKGYSLNNLGRYEEAINAFDKAIQFDPNSSLAWNNIGCTLNRLGRYDEAINAFDKAIKLDPNYSLAWYNRACVFSLITDKEQAMSNLKYAIELDPSYKEIARNDSDFEKLWTDEEFKKLVNNIK